MGRTIFIAFVLAALAMSSADGSPAQPAKTHKTAPATSAAHKKTQHAATRTAGHTARRAAGRTTPSRQRAGARSHAGSRNRHRRSLPGAKAGSPGRHGTPSLRKATLVAPPPPLRGSRDSLVRQNEKTEAEGLERILDDEDLADRIAQKALVPLPASAALTVNQDLPGNRRYCRPWTAKFLTDLASAHAAQFHSPIVVSSAVRTVEYQKQLEKINGNAAAAEGDVVSPHVTGSAIDIAKDQLSREELGWMRTRLLALETAGKIDVEEEFQQACFHITVYKSYVPPPPPNKVRRRNSAEPAAPVAIASRGM